MTLLLSSFLPALLTAACTGLFFYRNAPVAKRVVHTLARGVAAAVCFLLIYLAAALALAAVYLAFGWYSGGIAATRAQAVSLTVLATVTSTLVCLRPWQQVAN